jgi:peptidyl-prolyl cis-trans isomerase C
MGKNKTGKKPPSNKQGGKGAKGGGSSLKGGKLGASHILLKKLSEAQKIRDDLATGADFKELAKKHSLCSSKNKGGNLGLFGKEKMVPEFWNACTKLQINQISEPVKSQFGYHIIKRTK